MGAEPVLTGPSWFSCSGDGSHWDRTLGSDRQQHLNQNQGSCQSDSGPAMMSPGTADKAAPPVLHRDPLLEPHTAWHDYGAPVVAVLFTKGVPQIPRIAADPAPP